MKILFPYMARWKSAHASRFYHLLNHIAMAGHEVIVLQPPSRNSGEANDINVDLPDVPGVKVVTIDVWKNIWTKDFPFEKMLKKFLYTLASFRSVRNHINNGQVDVVYIYNLPQALYLLGAGKCVILYDIADDLLEMLKTELKINEQHPLFIIAKKVHEWIIKKSDAVICISSPIYESFQHPRKYIITNGTHDFEESGVLSVEAVPLGKFTAGYVGAFEYSMALDQMLDAAFLIPDVHFMLIGAGREYDRIASRIQNEHIANVELLGALPHHEAMERLRSCDVCMNLFHKTPVSHAVSPLKLFEYCSLGKPVITTRLVEVERIDEGFLYYADTPREIAEQIRFIQQHPGEAKEHAMNGRDCVRTKFTWNVLAKQTITILQPLLR